MCYLDGVRASVVVLHAVLALVFCLGRTLACPSVCFCNPLTSIAYCSRKNLPFIPEGIPASTIQINLNNNNFENPKLERANFTAFKFLVHLYLSDCGIQEIQADTFADLRNLKWLDLTNNKLVRIQDFTFRGLNLDNLFLSDNDGLSFSPNAFKGLRTTGLYLHSSGISNFTLDIFKPLNGTVRALWLDENNFEKFSIEWLYVFRTLSHLRLGHNPFHCNCEITWLRDFYLTNSSVFSNAIPPSCETPPRLKGKFFNEMSRDEFSCQLPVFSEVDITLDLDDGELLCEAIADPTPTLVWLKPSGKKVTFGPSLNESIHVTTAVLRITRGDGTDKEKYTCIAENPAGDVRVNVLVSWPLIPQPEVISADKQEEGGGGKPPYEKWEGYEPSQMGDTSAINATPSKEVEEKSFTVVQLVCAIVGTFLLSLLLCIILFHLYYKHQADIIFRESKEREKTPDNVYITSELDGEQAIKMINHHHHHHYATPGEAYDPQETPS